MRLGRTSCLTASRAAHALPALGLLGSLSKDFPPPALQRSWPLVDCPATCGYNRSATNSGGWTELANETGKRYFCETCGSEFVVTRGADGTISCCDKPMTKRS